MLGIYNTRVHTYDSPSPGDYVNGTDKSFPSDAHKANGQPLSLSLAVRMMPSLFTPRDRILNALGRPRLPPDSGCGAPSHTRARPHRRSRSIIHLAGVLFLSLARLMNRHCHDGEKASGRNEKHAKNRDTIRQIPLRAVSANGCGHHLRAPPPRNML